MGWIWSLVRCEMIKNVIKKMFHLISWLAPILSNDIIPISWQGCFKKRMSVPLIHYKRDPLTWRPYSHNLGSASSRALSWSQWHSTMEDLNLLKKFWKWCMCCKINGRAGGCRVGGCDSRPGIVWSQNNVYCILSVGHIAKVYIFLLLHFNISDWYHSL